MNRRRDSWLIAFAGCFTLIIAAVCLTLAFDDRPLTLALGVVAGCAAALAVLVEPFAGLLLYLTFIYLRPGDRYPALESLRLTLVIAFATCGVWLAQYLIRRRPALVRHPVNVCLLGLLAAGLLSFVPISIRGGLTAVLSGLAKSVVVAVLLANLVRTPGRQRAVVWVVVLLSAANAISAWNQVRAGETEFAGRAAGIGVMADPNDLALTLVMALPLAIALWEGERGFYRRLLAALAAAALVNGVVVSQSRGGALGLMVVLFLEGFERVPGRQLRTVYTVGALLAGFVALNAIFAQRGAGLLEAASEANAMSRRAAWTAGMRMMVRRPLTGVGLYQFPDRVAEFAPPGSGELGITAHNSLVLVAGELGVPGLAFFVALLGHTLASALRVRRRLAQQEATRTQRALGGAMARAFAGWFTCAFFLSQAYQVWLYILVGLVVSSEVLLIDAEEST